MRTLQEIAAIILDAFTNGYGGGWLCDTTETACKLGMITREEQNCFLLVIEKELQKSYGIHPRRCYPAFLPKSWEIRGGLFGAKEGDSKSRGQSRINWLNAIIAGEIEYPEEFCHVDA